MGETEGAVGAENFGGDLECNIVLGSPSLGVESDRDVDSVALGVSLDLSSLVHAKSQKSIF